MNIISIKDNPEYKEKAIQYIQSKWASKDSMMVYEDCISILKPYPKKGTDYALKPFKV